MFFLHNMSCALFLVFLALPASVRAAETPVKVTTTVTMVADLVRKVGGDRVAVETLMGPGVDPHLYKAAASDVSKLQQASLIFYSGLLLEGKMQDIFTNLARSKRRVYPVTEAIPLDRLLEPPEFAGHYDPHVWFDVTLWKLALDPVVKGLSEADPAGRAIYEQRAAEARTRLDELHAWALKKAAELPAERRILVTSHDAYNYFGRAYGFQVIGLQGISTVSEAGLADMAKLSDFIKEKGIKAVFVESSVPHNTIERISKDTGAKIGGELFSDAMGTAGQMENGYDLGTYEGMIKHNLSTIVEGLK
ncbi:MAG: zinc ABC transporter substrate-binding protein [Chthoniobacterales bacterium]|nr:zinc ABC transporter substrate-binding protein [Chthoniobacterales bacterium]